jgi:hypothetical protein
MSDREDRASRLVHLVADYGPGDLAFAQLAQRLELLVPEVTVTVTRVGPSDTLAAGFCAARLARGPGASRQLVVQDVTSARGAAERLCVARTAEGAVVAAANAGWCWSFLADGLRGLWQLDVCHRHGLAPGQAVAAAVTRMLSHHGHALGPPVSRDTVPALPRRVVAYVDGDGNVDTTIDRLPGPPGARVVVRIGGVSAPARVADSSATAEPGELTLRPGAIRGPAEAFLQLAVAGGSASRLFGDPPTGTPIALVRARPGRGDAVVPAQT